MTREPEPSLKLTQREIASAFADPHWAQQYPPIMTLDQSAEMLAMPKATLYEWRSRGLLGACSRRAGKRVLVFRDRLIDLIFNKGILDG